MRQGVLHVCDCFFASFHFFSGMLHFFLQEVVCSMGFVWCLQRFCVFVVVLSCFFCVFSFAGVFSCNGVLCFFCMEFFVFFFFLHFFLRWSLFFLCKWFFVFFFFAKSFVCLLAFGFVLFLFTLGFVLFFFIRSFFFRRCFLFFNIIPTVFPNIFFKEFFLRDLLNKVCLFSKKDDFFISKENFFNVFFFRQMGFVFFSSFFFCEWFCDFVQGVFFLQSVFFVLQFLFNGFCVFCKEFCVFVQ